MPSQNCLGQNVAHRNWQIGDKWTVRTWLAKAKQTSKKSYYIRKGRPIDIDFEVLSVKSLDDFDISYQPSRLSERREYNKLVKAGKIKKDEIKCFGVQVTYPVSGTGFQERYLLYFRKDKGNLIRILNNSRKADGSTRNFTTDSFPLDPNGPVITTDVPSLVPFDWPNWQKQRVAVEEKKVNKLRKQEIKERTLTDVKGKSYNGLEVTMKLIHKKDETEKLLSKTVQKWEKDAKWWQEIKRYDEKGEIISEAVLVKIGRI